MSHIPDNVIDELYAQYNNDLADGSFARVLCTAILNERKRCVAICEAEREWGGNIQDSQERIETGQPPRPIEGWNVPYQEDD